MRLAAICLLALVASPVAVAAAEGTKAQPSLRVGTLSPLRLDGEGFRKRERVEVTVSLEDATLRRTVRARHSGRFVARFHDIAIDRCSSGFTAHAVGRHGSRASAKLPQLQCPPAN
jgi:hypothetical protein